MTTIVTRTGKGSSLSWIEADANFTNLNTDKVENTAIVDMATKSGTETLTNKAISLSSNTVSGTKSQFNTACSDDDFAYVGSANIFTQDQTLEGNLTLTGLGKRITGDITYVPNGTGAVATTVQAKLHESVSVKDFGAVGDGVTDDRAAFALADAAGASELTVTSGTYKVSSNLTINTPLKFSTGAVLKPVSGVTITLGASFQAPVSQVFDLSLGGVVALPRSCNEVYAEWWGAKGDGYLGIGTGAKLDNNVPIQQAIDALTVIVQGVYGGKVLLDRGDFYVSAQINLYDQISLGGVFGSSYPALFANTSGWAASSSMIYASNGTSSMFNSRVENMRLVANSQANISYVVKSVAWQEKCGLRNVLITDFVNSGFYQDANYGGASELTIQDTEIWAAAGASASNCIRVDASTYTAGWLKLNLSRCTLAGAMYNQVGLNGVNVTGRVIANLNCVHFEQMASAVVIANASCLTGNSITSDGNASVTRMINCAASWTGTVDALNVKKCGATNYIVDSNRSYAIAQYEPFDDHLIWPPSPGNVIWSGLITGGATPAFVWQKGPVGGGSMTVSHTATGVQTITLPVTFPGYLFYDVIADSGDAAAPFAVVENLAANQFKVYTRSLSNVATDSANFVVRVYSRP